ncbi:hypothetical protein IE53DRAFT_385632 [Violaceomyces palustris]|uniref:Uncharacterized protein n=1 Tax=Violaceomyces palustris TaxID=1673888 RepID=A0ACD0P1T4_9BASI|nr:hypothetical protein IE53DRAFT_385632 [Violaceomyces palustris]
MPPPTESQSKLTKKQQKAEAFKKATKKRKGDSQIPDGGDLPQMDDEIESEPQPSTSTLEPSREREREKNNKGKGKGKSKEEEEEKEDEKASAKSKKRKRNEIDASNTSPSSSSAVVPAKSQTEAASKTIKAKKTTFAEDGEKVETELAVPSTTTKAAGEEEEGGEKGKTSAKSKYIVFVGNMSFDLTSDDISKHFGKTCGEVPSVRLLTKKGDPSALASLSKSKQKSIAKGKAKDPSAPQSKGCAFLEFKTHTALQKALLFHHTMYGGRQINVELSAGGGGKSQNRVEKIKKKNEALEKERAKIHEKYLAPANANHKAIQAEKASRGEGGPPKKKLRQDEEGQAQWGSRGSGGSSDRLADGNPPAIRSRRKPGAPSKFSASGSNAVRLQG